MITFVLYICALSQIASQIRLLNLIEALKTLFNEELLGCYSESAICAVAP